MSVPFSNTSFSGVSNRAGSQFGIINSANVQAQTESVKSAVIQNAVFNNLSVIPLSATGANVATVVGYAPSGTLTTSYFLNTTRGASAAALAGSAGVLTIPSGAKITAVSVSNVGTALAGSNINIGYQATASNAAAGSNSQLMAATAASVFPANSVAQLSSVVPVALGGVPVTVTFTALTAEQSVTITSASSTTGGPIAVTITYYL